MTDWKSIDSAPRDGSIILLHNAHLEPSVTIGCYDEDDGWLLVEADFMPSRGLTPSHWTDLPNPPEDIDG